MGWLAPLQNCQSPYLSVCSGFLKQLYHNGTKISLWQAVLYTTVANRPKIYQSVAWNNNKINFPWTVDEINFKAQRNCGNSGKLLPSVSFHKYFQVFQIKFQNYVWHLVLIEMISFKYLFKKVMHKFVIQCNRTGYKVLPVCYSNFHWILS